MRELLPIITENDKIETGVIEKEGTTVKLAPFFTVYHPHKHWAENTNRTFAKQSYTLSLQDDHWSMCVFASVSLHYQPWCSLRLPVDEQGKDCEAECQRQAGWTVNFLNPPPFVSPTPALCSLSRPLSPISLPTLLLPPLYSASVLSVAAFDLGTSIKANLIRQRKVTCTQGGQGEVAFVPRGDASVPEDCGLCDENEVGGFPFALRGCA